MPRPKRKKQKKRVRWTEPKEKLARRSTGGRAPRKLLQENKDKVWKFDDHAGATYTVVSGPRCWPRNPSVIPKLSVHLYCLDDPEPSPHALALNICSKRLSDDRFDPRVDIYTGFDSIEQCIDHHRREKAYRRKAAEDLRRAVVDGMSEEDAQEFLTTQHRGKEPLPHIVPTWCEGISFWRQGIIPPDRFKSWILVMKKDCRTWADVEEQGILLVQFDLDWSIEMETEIEPDFAADSLIPDDRQPWMIVYKVERPPPIQTTLLCVRSEPSWTWDDFRQPDGSIDYDRYAKFRESWKTPGHQGTLSGAWQGFSRVIWGDPYKDEDCDGCKNDEPHDKCERELSEHYFDDEGQCIACRRLIEYRRRSKRLANKATQS